MSLIVARKQGNQLAIVSDTKLTYPNEDIKGQKNNPSEGVIKTVIINPNLCVSFAGDIDYAEKAIKELNNNHSIEETIKILEKYHNRSDYKTEFLVCAGKPSPIIHKIKVNESKDVHSSWIGDIKAFSSFQENLMGNKKN